MKMLFDDGDFWRFKTIQIRNFTTRWQYCIEHDCNISDYYILKINRVAVFIILLF